MIYSDSIVVSTADIATLNRPALIITPAGPVWRQHDGKNHLTGSYSTHTGEWLQELCMMSSCIMDTDGNALLGYTYDFIVMTGPASFLRLDRSHDYQTLIHPVLVSRDRVPTRYGYGIIYNQVLGSSLVQVSYVAREIEDEQ